PTVTRPMLQLMLIGALIYCFLYHSHSARRDLHSFPTRRSSDLPPLLLGTAPAGSSQELQNTEEAEDPAWVMMLGQWCSPPATADGTLVALDWRATIATYQSSTSADFLHVIGAWIMGADGSFREQLAAGIFVGELPTGAPEGEQMTLAVGRGADLLPQDIFE